MIFVANLQHRYLMLSLWFYFRAHSYTKISNEENWQAASSNRKNSNARIGVKTGFIVFATILPARIFFSFWLGRYFIDKCYVRLTLLHSWVNKNKINRTCKKYYQELHVIWCDVVVVEEEKWNNNWDYLIPLSIIIRQFNCTHTHIIRGKIVNCAKQRKNERTRPDVEHYLLDACAIYPMR